MSEFKDTVKLANRLLDEPNCDPDDDLRMLARQFLRGVERVERLQKDLVAMHDPHGDLIAANMIPLQSNSQSKFTIRTAT
jgi:hypothetical protein